MAEGVIDGESEDGDFD